LSHLNITINDILYVVNKNRKNISEIFKKTLDNISEIVYNVLVRQRGTPLTKGSEVMEDGMTNAEFNAFLETLARLVESKAKTLEEAAELIREAKTK
jgi:hypothetical protein